MGGGVNTEPMHPGRRWRRAAYPLGERSAVSFGLLLLEPAVNGVRDEGFIPVVIMLGSRNGDLHESIGDHRLAKLGGLRIAIILGIDIDNRDLDLSQIQIRIQRLFATRQQANSDVTDDRGIWVSRKGATGHAAAHAVSHEIDAFDTLLHPEVVDGRLYAGVCIRECRFVLFKKFKCLGPGAALAC
jgi:hypothetical protein